MSRHLKHLILLPLAVFLLQTPATAGYEETVQVCLSNLDQSRLSPQIAEDCVRDLHADPSILERLKDEKPEAASNLVAYNSALKDYKKTIASYKDLAFARQYERIMFSQACPLCDMNLGPKPEESFSWVAKYLPNDLGDFKYSVRTWEALGPVRTPLLSADGRTKESWNAMDVLDRYQALQSWAIYVVAQTTPVPAGVYPDKAQLARLIPVLKEDLFHPALAAQLDAYLAGGNIKPVVIGNPAASKAAKDKISRTSADMAALRGMNTGAQSATLENFFNGTGHRPAGDFQLDKKPGAKKPARPYTYTPLSDDQITALGPRLLAQGADGKVTGALANEIRGTKAGDEILAFYADKKYKSAGTNKLAFGLEPMEEGMFGGWNWVNEDIKINSGLVNDWMKKNKVTPEMLMQGDPAKNKHLRGLSEYLAPTFVHEATHQRQTANDKARGIDLVKAYGKSNSYYQMEKETEAFSMDASFTAEKFAKLPKAQRKAYLARLDPFDKKNAETYLKQGVDGVRLSNHKGYAARESLDGEASKQFVMAKSTAQQLEALKARDQATLTEFERQELARLQAEMNSRYKWYTYTMQDSVAAEAKINLWRQEIRRKISGNRTIKEGPVPTLLSQ